MIDRDIEFDEEALICIKDNGHIYYIIVERDGELSYTGLSVIRRLMEDKNKFIGDFYSTQSYFCIKYIDEKNIGFNPNFKGANRNELTSKELDDIIKEDDYNNIYSYDVQEDTLFIKSNGEESLINFYDLYQVEEFLKSIDYK